MVELQKPGQTMLKGLAVRDAMRRRIIRAMREAPLEDAIRILTKYKVNALLVTDASDAPAGVLSKTDVMGAYYAGLPVDSPVESVMIAPPLFCGPDDPLESALAAMRENRVYRLYVAEPEEAGGPPVGVIAYPDIVGLLYRYCRDCEVSHAALSKKSQGEGDIHRYTVGEAMTEPVRSFRETDSLTTIMEGLSVDRFGAVLITGESGTPGGVVSKTDLILAYRHGVDPGVSAERIMSTPVRSIDESELMETAVRMFILSDIHRLFVHRGDPGSIVGVLTLTDAARLRSGSCRACIAGRIKVEQES